MSTNREASPAVGRGAVIYQDDDDDEIHPPSNRSRGGTPLQRSSSSLLMTSPSTSRNTTPRPRSISYEDLASRPRSNPRARTPMRYESPLHANAFRPPTPTQEGQRVTIRPLAGSAVGTSLLSRRIQEEENSRVPTTTYVAPHRSSKQGPSHRKVKRWNRDNFVGLASHLAQHGSSTKTAEALLLAQADAPRYKSIYNPLINREPSAMSIFNQDKELQQVRQDFFEGEIGHGPMKQRQYAVQKEKPASLQRIHERLRNVVVRACTNGNATTIQQVDALEECLKECFGDNQSNVTSTVLQQAGIDTLLLHDGRPVVVVSNPRLNRATANFYFNSSSQAGFHRLLLHALCQFHGLAATSRTTTDQQPAARLLTVSGKKFGLTSIKLTDYIFEAERKALPEMHQLETSLAAATIQA